jgi:hypothetical protein
VEAPKPTETTSEPVITTPKTTTKPATTTPSTTTTAPTPQPVVNPPVKTCVADTSTIAVLEAQRQSELMNAEVKRTNDINAIPYQDSSYYQRRVAEVEMVYQNTINSVNSIYNAKIQAVPKICTTQ